MNGPKRTLEEAVNDRVKINIRRGVRHRACCRTRLVGVVWVRGVQLESRSNEFSLSFIV
jgi:hypothetical protein